MGFGAARRCRKDGSLFQPPHRRPLVGGAQSRRLQYARTGDRTPTGARCRRAVLPAPRRWRESLALGATGLGAGGLIMNPRFLRIAALCSMLSALTTPMLIFLPELFSSAQGFEARMARVHETAYRVRAWAYLVHPFLVLTAAFGIAHCIRREAPALAIAGLLGFTWWAFTEASQQTLTLFACDR